MEESGAQCIANAHYAENWNIATLDIAWAIVAGTRPATPTELRLARLLADLYHENGELTDTLAAWRDDA